MNEKLIERLEEHGFKYIGEDKFTKSSDEICITIENDDMGFDDFIEKYNKIKQDIIIQKIIGKTIIGVELGEYDDIQYILFSDNTKISLWANYDGEVHIDELEKEK